MVILTGNDETVCYNKMADKLWVKEVYWEGKIIGYNVMVNDEVIDTYEEDDNAVIVVKHIFNSQDVRVCIDDINFILEVY